MPITQNIPRKQGRMQQHTTSPVVHSQIFGVVGNNNTPPNRTVDNPTDPLLYRDTGDAYNTLNTTSSKHPMGKSLNTATQRTIVPLGNIGATGLARPIGTASAKFTEVAPHEHGNFFAPKPIKKADIRTSGGVSKQSDTPFHPVKGFTPPYRPRRHPARAGERTNAPSFDSTAHLTGNPNQDTTVSAVVSTGGKTSKWGGVKVSAADNIHPASGFTGSHPRGVVVNVSNASGHVGNGGSVSTGKGAK